MKSILVVADEDPSNRSHQGCKGVDDRLGDGSSQGAGIVCRGLEANVISFMQGYAKVVWAGEGDTDGDMRKALLANWVFVARGWQVGKAGATGLVQAARRRRPG